MTKRTTLITIGILLILSPFYGIPSLASHVIIGMLGLAVVVVGLFSGPPRPPRVPDSRRTPTGLADELTDDAFR